MKNLTWISHVYLDENLANVFIVSQWYFQCIILKLLKKLLRVTCKILLSLCIRSIKWSFFPYQLAGLFLNCLLIFVQKLVIILEHYVQVRETLSYSKLSDGNIFVVTFIGTCFQLVFMKSSWKLIWRLSTVDHINKSPNNSLLYLCQVAFLALTTCLKTIVFSLKSEAKKAYLHANERRIMLW